MSVTEQRILMAEIDATAAALARCYQSLPPEAQAQVLLLGQGMARVRCQLDDELNPKAATVLKRLPLAWPVVKCVGNPVNASLKAHA